MSQKRGLFPDTTPLTALLVLFLIMIAACTPPGLVNLQNDSIVALAERLARKNNHRQELMLDLRNAGIQCNPITGFSVRKTDYGLDVFDSAIFPDIPRRLQVADEYYRNYLSARSLYVCSRYVVSNELTPSYLEQADLLFNSNAELLFTARRNRKD